MTTANIDSIATRSIERHLARVFDDDPRRVERSLTGVHISRAGGRGTITADVALTVAWDGSSAASRGVRPRVSCIDGLVLAIELAEAYLTYAYRLGLDERQRMWLRAFELRHAAPGQDLAEFPARAVDVGCVPVAGSLCGHVSTFDCQIGTIRVSCAIEHDIVSRNPFGGRYEFCDDILGDAGRRHYANGHARRTQRVADLAVDPRARELGAVVTIDDPHARAEDLGFAGAYGPSASLVDALLGVVRLTEVLRAGVGHAGREGSGASWMQRLAFSSPSPALALDTPLDVSLTLPRSRPLATGGAAWRSLELRGNFGDVVARGSIAHALPRAAPELGVAA